MRRFPNLYKFDLSMDAEKLKLTVMQMADSHPIDFIMAVKEPKSFTKLVVDDLAMRKLIIFDNHEKNINWIFRDKKTGNQITKASSEAKSVEELVAYLLNEAGKGNKHLVELYELFEKHYMPR